MGMTHILIVLRVWSLGWYYWEMTEPLRGEAQEMVLKSLLKCLLRDSGSPVLSSLLCSLVMR
jgi:hypothetical protein